MRVLGRGGGGGGEGVLGVPRQVRRMVASIGWAGCHPPYQDQNCICVSEFGCTNMCTFVLVCISNCDTEKAVFRLWWPSLVGSARLVMTTNNNDMMVIKMTMMTSTM